MTLKTSAITAPTITPTSVSQEFKRHSWTTLLWCLHVPAKWTELRMTALTNIDSSYVFKVHQERIDDFSLVCNLSTLFYWCRWSIVKYNKPSLAHHHNGRELQYRPVVWFAALIVLYIKQVYILLPISSLAQQSIYIISITIRATSTSTKNMSRFTSRLSKDKDISDGFKVMRWSSPVHLYDTFCSQITEPKYDRYL